MMPKQRGGMTQLLSSRGVVPLAAVAAVFSACSADRQPSRTVSTATSACRDCRFEIDSVATLGRSETSGEYFVTPSFTGAVVGERLLVAATVPLLLFDLEGRFLGTHGRQGPGPGEFPGWIRGISVGPGRTVHTFVSQQVLVFDSSFGFLRKVPLARGSLGPTVLSDGRYAGMARVPPSRGGGPPARDGYTRTFPGPLFHLFGGDGTYLRSVGSSLSFADEIIAAGANGSIWTGKRAPYEIRQWSQDGSLLRVVERVTPSFDRTPYIGPWPYVPGQGPRPRLLAIRQDSAGRLWTAFAVRRQGVDQRTLSEGSLETCCETIIEVFDPVTGALLGTGKVPFYVHHLVDGGYIIAGTTGSNGEPLIVLYRAHLHVPGRP